jgi:hypothetical protein
MFSSSDTKNTWIPGISRKPKGLAFSALSTAFPAQGGDPRRVAQATRKVLFINRFSRPHTLWAITKFDKTYGQSVELLILITWSLWRYPLEPGEKTLCA